MINVGDIVRCRSDERSTRVLSKLRFEEECEVVRVKRRYAMYPGGQKQGDLVTVRLANNEEGHFCESLLEIARCPKGALPENATMPYASRVRALSHARYYKTMSTNPVKGVWYGQLTDLVELALAGVTEFRIPYPIDPEKAADLFMKQRPGLIELVVERLTAKSRGQGPNLFREFERGPTVKVNVKPFRKWARQNALRMMVSKKDLVAIDTASEQRMRESYDLEADWGDDFCYLEDTSQERGWRDDWEDLLI